jgi:hypothetical protein
VTLGFIPAELFVQLYQTIVHIVHHSAQIKELGATIGAGKHFLGDQTFVLIEDLPTRSNNHIVKDPAPEPGKTGHVPAQEIGFAVGLNGGRSRRASIVCRGHFLEG